MGTKFSKGFFFTALALFLLLQVTGALHPTYRVLHDEVCCDLIPFHAHGYFTPKFRYAYILNKFLVVGAMCFHLPFKTIGLIYCFNDALFYIVVSCLIIFLTKRYDYAAVVLLAPVLIHKYYFYEIICELFLSGSVMVLFAAVYKTMEMSLKRTLVLSICLFFIIWGHPIMLAVFLLFYLSINESIADVKKDWKILAFALLNIAIRCCFFVGYDKDRMQDSIESGLSAGNWAAGMTGYIRDYWFIIVLMVFLLIFSETKSQKRNAILSWIFFICMVPIFFSKYFAFQFAFSKSTYPVNLFVLTQTIVLMCELHYQKKFITAISIFMICITINSFQFFIGWNRDFQVPYIEFFNKINQYCYSQSPLQSKWYVKDDSLKALIPFVPTSLKTMFISSCNQNPVTVQVVFIDKEHAHNLEIMTDDSIYIYDGYHFSINDLDTFNFHVLPGKYRELKCDSIIKSFCHWHWGDK